MPDLYPQWTSQSWAAIRDAQWENGGWIISEQVQCLVIERGLWGEEPDPDPDPDPSNMYRMDYSEWQKISGGDLHSNMLDIAKGGNNFRVAGTVINEQRKAIAVQQ